MSLSKYLTYQEATKSAVAITNGIVNAPDPFQLENMRYVATEIFDKVREQVGAPLGVSSFFRSKELNKLIGGSSTTSQHMKGEAIDIDADLYGNGDNLSIFNYIRKALVFDQLILEYPDIKGVPSWVHVSLRREPAINRMEVLVKLKDRYIPFSAFTVGMT